MNKIIKDDVKVYTKSVSLEKAKKINGLRAVFGESYPDPVRVVSVGNSVDELIADRSTRRLLGISILWPS